MRNSTVLSSLKEVMDVSDFFRVINSFMRFSVLVSWLLLEFQRFPRFIAIKTIEISESIMKIPCDEGLMMRSGKQKYIFISHGKRNIHTITERVESNIYVRQCNKFKLMYWTDFLLKITFLVVEFSHLYFVEVLN